MQKRATLSLIQMGIEPSPEYQTCLSCPFRCSSTQQVRQQAPLCSQASQYEGHHHLKMPNCAIIWRNTLLQILSWLISSQQAYHLLPPHIRAQPTFSSFLTFLKCPEVVEQSAQLCELFRFCNSSDVIALTIHSPVPAFLLNPTSSAGLVSSPLI